MIAKGKLNRLQACADVCTGVVDRADAEPSIARLALGSPLAPTVGEGAPQLLEQALRASRAFAPAVFRWLQDGLLAYVNEGRAGTLERHLGLKVKQHKGRSTVRRRVVKTRWNALAAAYAAQIDCDDRAPLRRCAILVADIKEFEKLFWPDWRRSGLPKSAPSQLRQALFDVFVAYEGIPPRNANSIYRALGQAGVIVPTANSHV